MPSRRQRERQTGRIEYGRHNASEKWAPAELVSLHENEFEKGEVHYSDLWRGNLLKALISDWHMKDVWKTLLRRRQEFQTRLLAEQAELPKRLAHSRGEAPVLVAYMKGQRNSSQALDLYSACEKALDEFRALPVHTHPKWSNAQARSHYSSVAKHAEALASLLEQMPWNVRGFTAAQLLAELIPHSNLAEVARSIGVDDDLGLGELFRSVEEWGGVAYDPWRKLPDLLRRLSERARERAEDRPVLAQPRSEESERRYFQLAISGYFKRAYGAPLHKQVAAVTSAAFHTDISEDTVKKLAGRLR